MPKQNENSISTQLQATRPGEEGEQRRCVMDISLTHIQCVLLFPLLLSLSLSPLRYFFRKQFGRTTTRNSGEKEERLSKTKLKNEAESDDDDRENRDDDDVTVAIVSRWKKNLLFLSSIGTRLPSTSRVVVPKPAPME